MSDEEIDSLYEERAELEAKIKGLESRLKASVKAHNEIFEALRECEEKRNEQSSRLNAIKKDADMQPLVHYVRYDDFKAIESRLSESANRAEQWAAKLTAKDTEIARLTEIVDDATIRLDDRQKRLDALESKLTAGGNLYAIECDRANELQRRLDSINRLNEKLIHDTGKGCSVCGDTPVVNIPGGSGTYWLCGDCVADRFETSDLAVNDLGTQGVELGNVRAERDAALLRLHTLELRFQELEGDRDRWWRRTDDLAHLVREVIKDGDDCSLDFEDWVSRAEKVLSELPRPAKAGKYVCNCGAGFATPEERLAHLASCAAEKGGFVVETPLLKSDGG